MATYLAQRGFTVDIYERRDDMRSVNLSAGRSINLALSVRGIHALKEVGLYVKIQPITIPMKGRMIHDMDGKTHLQPYGQRDDEVIYSVSRAQLNKDLMTLAEGTGKVRIHFNHELSTVDLQNNMLSFSHKNTGEIVQKDFTCVIGCDGSASVLRDEIVNKTKARYTKKPLGHGYKELLIPPSDDGQFQLDSHALHIWPRGEYMLIALPNMDGSFTCTLFLPMSGKISFDSMDTGSKISELFQSQFSDAIDLMPTLAQDFRNNPTGELASVYCDPWHFQEKAALIGDSAHAVVPFFGQGMNASFQDCTVMNKLMGDYAGDWGDIFSNYSKLHVNNGHAIADMAIENYIEMRDHVNDPNYIKRRKLELDLEKRFPGQFIPRYSMVSFHQFPYSDVYKRGEKQFRIIDEILRVDPSGENIDRSLVNKLLKS
ncbi:MAG: FAD-dependent monooxygenase [Candidatus Marinimicrobia bacterium]|nr:FAD-dependent monooxygenase [Candidatus Neomarinimicrobiota bacterium]MBL7029996.1 FAD-dependent monooxygenase [Candidatus Neomarinimicrobiota bacterium]